MDWFLIVGLFFVLPILFLIIYVFRSFDANNGITILEMYKFEKDIDRRIKPYFEKKDCFDVAKTLKLFIEEDVDSSRIEHKESQLGPTSKGGYNGEILIAKTDVKYLPNFRCYHELVHYFNDVGVGKTVRKVYGKDPQGETRSHKEQIINYYAAAIAVPREKLLNDLRNVQNPTADEKFIEGLMKRYKQPESTIIRRIEEVSLMQ